MCPRIWPMENICIGLNVLQRLLNVRHILENVNATQFRRVLRKKRRNELTSVVNFVTKRVLVESANQFSLEELCRKQYSLKYFFKAISTIRPMAKPKQSIIICELLSAYQFCYEIFKDSNSYRILVPVHWTCLKNAMRQLCLNKTL